MTDHMIDTIMKVIALVVFFGILAGICFSPGKDWGY